MGDTAVSSASSPSSGNSSQTAKLHNKVNELQVDQQPHHGLEQKRAYDEVTAANAALQGHAATDKYGKSLVNFDPVAEKRLRLKIDFFIVPTVSLIYLFCFIDRANIGNAKIAGLEKDLGLKGYDYNVVLTVFYISFIIFEIPSTLACKLVGPGWFIPSLGLGFGIVSICTAFVHNKAQIAAVRFLLGVFESGINPSMAYYLSRWYRRSELAFRISLYMVMVFVKNGFAYYENVTAPLAGAFGGLLASGILRLSHFGGLHSWRMIFAIEGIITIGLSLLAFCTLPDGPATAIWLTQEEKDLAIARVKSERVATTELLDKIDLAKVKRGVFSPVTVATAFIFFLNNITVQGLAFFAPTIVKTIYPKSTVISQQLHTVPPYVVGSFFCLLYPFLSWHWDRRIIFFIVTVPCAMLGYILFLSSHSSDVRYGATFAIAIGAFGFGPLTNAIVAVNVLSDTARTGAIGTNVMFGNTGGLIATWSFLPFDSPDYRIGNGLNLATSTLILICSTALLFWMNWDNRKRELLDLDAELAALDGLSKEDIQDLDWKHPAFRWKP